MRILLGALLSGLVGFAGGRWSAPVVEHSDDLVSQPDRPIAAKEALPSATRAPIVPARVEESIDAEPAESVDSKPPTPSDTITALHDLDVLGRRFIAVDRERKRLETENRYLRVEIAAYFKESVATRPVFNELRDPDGRFTLEELQSSLVELIARAPMRLSDGDLLRVAPIAAEYDAAILDLKARRADARDDPTLTPEARAAVFKEIGELWPMQSVVLRRRLVEVLGEDRVAVHFKDWEQPDSDSR